MNTDEELECCLECGHQWVSCKHGPNPEITQAELDAAAGATV